jgi:hypothetical protein
VASPVSPAISTRTALQSPRATCALLMEILLLLAPVFIPAMGFASGYQLGGRQIAMGMAGAFAFGLIGGAFIGSAASAMSTANDSSAILRGAGAGAAAGLATGMLIATVMQLLRRRRK